jgi:hypothetical protein
MAMAKMHTERWWQINMAPRARMTRDKLISVRENKTSLAAAATAAAAAIGTCLLGWLATAAMTAAAATATRREAPAAAACGATDIYTPIVFASGSSRLAAAEGAMSADDADDEQRVSMTGASTDVQGTALVTATIGRAARAATATAAAAGAATEMIAMSWCAATAATRTTTAAGAATLQMAMSGRAATAAAPTATAEIIASVGRRSNSSARVATSSSLHLKRSSWTYLAGSAGEDPATEKHGSSLIVESSSTQQQDAAIAIGLTVQGASCVIAYDGRAYQSGDTDGINDSGWNSLPLERRSNPQHFNSAFLRCGGGSREKTADTKTGELEMSFARVCSHGSGAWFAGAA